MLARLRRKKYAENTQNVILPEELLVHLFSFFTPEERANAGEACRTWHRVSNEFAKVDKLYIEEKKKEKAERRKLQEEQSEIQEAENEAIKQQQEKVIDNIEDFFSNTGEQKIRISVIGKTNDKKAIFDLSCLSPSATTSAHIRFRATKISGNTICFQELSLNDKDARAINTYLNSTNYQHNLFIFCPDSTSPDSISKQLLSVLKKLSASNIHSPIMFVLTDEKIDIPNIFSLQIDKEDSLETLGNRMLSLLQSEMLNHQKDRKNRCLVS